MRALTWDGCVNVRDLGGVPLRGGGTTRLRSVVRADNVRRLSAAGWEALVAYGVRTAVDLRWREELADDPPGDLPIGVVHVSLFGELDEGYWAELSQRLERWSDRIDVTRESNLELLARHRAQLAEAVTAVARAADGGVLVHCVAGKDRTGLVSALLLRLAGVEIADVADDYGESNANLAALTEIWRDAAPDEEERARRRQLNGTPRESMVGVLEELERRHGSVRDYLLAGGATAADLDRAAARLR